MTEPSYLPPFLQFKLDDFIQQVQSGEFNHPLGLLEALEKLQDNAADALDDLYQSSIRIDP